MPIVPPPPGSRVGTGDRFKRQPPELPSSADRCRFSLESAAQTALYSLGWFQARYRMKPEMKILLALPVVAVAALSGVHALAALSLLLLPFALFLGFAPGGDGDDEEEGAKTIVGMSLWSIEQMAKEEKEKKEGKKEAAPDAPPAPDDAPPDGTASSKTLMFDPRAPSAPDDAPPQAPQDDMASAKTAMFDPRALQTSDDAPADEMASAKTLMFDPRAAGILPPDSPPPPAPAQPKTSKQPDSTRTAAWSLDDFKKVQDFVDARKDSGEDASSKTVAYMPAVDEPTQDGPDKGKANDEAYAPTQLFMPAADPSMETAAYGPEERKKLLEAIEKRGVVDDGSAATAAYSKEQVQAIREGYALLERSKGGTDADEPTSRAKPVKPAPRAEQTRPPRPSVSTSPVVPDTAEAESKGMGTLPVVLILVALLALAGAATAVILHFLGIVDLPIGLPQLDIF